MFYVGGTGSYDGVTNHFATTTGGTASVAAVTSADTVTFDSNSGVGTVTMTANWSSGAVTMNQTGLTLTTNGTATFTVAAASTLTLTNGTINTNGSTCSWGKLLLGVGTKTLTLGATNLSLTATSGTALDLNTNSAGLTFNANTSTIKNTVANVTLGLGTQTYNIIDVTVTTVTLSGSPTITTLQCIPVAATGAMILLTALSTYTITNLTLTCTDSGVSAARGWLTTSTTPNVNLVTVNATNVTLTNFDFTNITAGGTIPWTGTALGDGQGNSNITFPASRTMYWVGAAAAWNTLARWATSTGGATGGNNMPRAHDNVFIDANSAITNASISVTRTLGGNLDFSAANSVFTLNAGLSPSVVFGSLTLKSGMTISGTGTMALCGQGAFSITTNGVAFNSTGSTALQLAAPNGTYTLQDDLAITASTTTSVFAYFAGGLDFNNHNVSCPSFSSTLANARTWNMGSGTLFVTGTGTVISVSDVNLTLNAGTSTISQTDTSATGKTVNLPNVKTVNNVTLAGGTGNIVLEWAGAVNTHLGTITNLTINAPASIVSPSGQTTTILGSLSAVGSAGNTISWVSGTAGTAFNLSKTSGIVSCDYLSLQDSAATGGASWYAGANSTNVSGNSGWIFAAAPSLGGTMLLMGI